MEKKRCLFSWAILTGEYPPQPGGVSDYTRLLGNALVKAGEEVVVWAPPISGSELSNPQATVYRLSDRFGIKSRRELGQALRALPIGSRVLVQYVPQAFGWKQAFSPVIRLSAVDLYNRGGAAGSIDAQVDALAWGALEAAQKVPHRRDVSRSGGGMELWMALARFSEKCPRCYYKDNGVLPGPISTTNLRFYSRMEGSAEDFDYPRYQHRMASRPHEHPGGC